MSKSNSSPLYTGRDRDNEPKPLCTLASQAGFQARYRNTFNCFLHFLLQFQSFRSKVFALSFLLVENKEKYLKKRHSIKQINRFWVAVVFSCLMARPKLETLVFEIWFVEWGQGEKKKKSRQLQVCFVMLKAWRDVSMKRRCPFLAPHPTAFWHDGKPNQRVVGTAGRGPHTGRQECGSGAC